MGKLANKENMIHVDSLGAGSQIDSNAEALVKTAKQYKTRVYLDFNGVAVWAGKRSNPTSVVNRWRKSYNADCKRYLKSKEHKEYEKKQIKENSSRDLRVDAYLETAKTLDWSDYAVVLKFLADICYDFGTIGYKEQNAIILQYLLDNGYNQNANLGPDFNGDDPENYARYIIGQAIDGLACSVGCMHDMVVVFYERWLRDFDPENEFLVGKTEYVKPAIGPKPTFE